MVSAYGPSVTVSSPPLRAHGRRGLGLEAAAADHRAGRAQLVVERVPDLHLGVELRRALLRALAVAVREAQQVLHGCLLVGWFRRTTRDERRTRHTRAELARRRSDAIEPVDDRRPGEAVHRHRRGSVGRRDRRQGQPLEPGPRSARGRGERGVGTWLRRGRRRVDAPISGFAAAASPRLSSAIPSTYDVRPLRRRSARSPTGRPRSPGHQRAALRAVGRRAPRLRAVEPLHLRAGAGLVVDRAPELVHDDARVIGVGDVEGSTAGRSCRPWRRCPGRSSRSPRGGPRRRGIEPRGTSSTRTRPVVRSPSSGDSRCRRSRSRRRPWPGRRAVPSEAALSMPDSSAAVPSPAPVATVTAPAATGAKVPRQPGDPGNGGAVGRPRAAPSAVGEVQRERRGGDRSSSRADVRGHRRAPRGLRRGAPRGRDPGGRELDPVAGAEPRRRPSSGRSPRRAGRP